MKKLYSLLFSAIALLPAGVNAQWSTDPNEDNHWIPTGTYTYENEIMTDKNGNSWFSFQRPIGSSIVEYRVQMLDKYGNAKFEDPLGLLISAYSSPYSVINQQLFIDSDNNLIVAVHDARHSQEGAENMTYTAYKISPEGQMLWGEDGVALNPEIISELTGAMTITELDDKSIVFAWMRYIEDLSCIDMQRVSTQGEILWDIEKMSIQDSSMPHSYPYVVNARNNQFILVYAKGSGADLYARKIDFDGTSVWENDVRIYRGGWGSSPVWTNLSVTSSGDGGVLVSWSDYRDSEEYTLPYLSYITGDGQLGFSAASSTGDVRLDWEVARQGNGVKAFPAPDGNGFYAYWVKTDKTQNWNSLALQRISKNGELLWGELAVALTDFYNSRLGHYTILPSTEGTLAAFYMHNHSYYNITTHCCQIYATSGELIPEKSLMFTSDQHYRSGLLVTVCESEEFWMTTWRDEGDSTSTETSYCCKRINFDMTYGSEHTSGIHEIALADKNFEVKYINGSLIISKEPDSDLRIDVYDMAGRKVMSETLQSSANTVIITCPQLTPGVYAACITNGKQQDCSKIVVN